MQVLSRLIRISMSRISFEPGMQRTAHCWSYTLHAVKLQIDCLDTYFLPETCMDRKQEVIRYGFAHEKGCWVCNFYISSSGCHFVAYRVQVLDTT